MQVGYPWVVPTFLQAHPHLAAKGEFKFKKTYKILFILIPGPQREISGGSDLDIPSVRSRQPLTTKTSKISSKQEVAIISPRDTSLEHNVLSNNIMTDHRQNNVVKTEDRGRMTEDGMVVVRLRSSVFGRPSSVCKLAANAIDSV